MSNSEDYVTILPTNEAKALWVVVIRRYRRDIDGYYETTQSQLPMKREIALKVAESWGIAYNLEVRP